MAVMIGIAAGMEYNPPVNFIATLYSATVDVCGELIKDSEAEMRAHLARHRRT